MSRQTGLSYTICCLLLVSSQFGSYVAGAIAPPVKAFILNTDGAKGQSSDAAMDAVLSQISADVQQVSYTDDSVFVTTTGVPRYETGPYRDANPAVASDINSIYKIPLDPIYDDSGDPAALGLGAMGIFVNGVAIFNAEDGVTYNDQNRWHRNAILAEADGFDSCEGHPAPVMGGGTVDGFTAGFYHHHLKSQCLLDQLGDDGTGHSPILGFAADGFPVYGPYGYLDSTDPNSAIVRIESSYEARDISARTTLPDGTVLAAAFYGPAVTISGQYRLGWYMEDFEYDPTFGDLDEHNGRFAVTPEYPNGIYAYYVTVDASGNGEFPYFLGSTFRGVLESGGTDCAGHGDTWGPGIGPPPPGCEGGGATEGGVATVDEVPANAVIYAPEPAALPMALSAQAILGVLMAVSALRALRSSGS
jgi:hypothetical protein